MTKITALPADSSPTGDDYTVSVDTTSGQTKKVLLSDLLAYINASGVPLATNISNTCKFSVYRNAAWTTGNSALAVVAFDTELFDTGNNMDVVTNKGKFTAPVSGYYWFSGSVQELGTTDGALVIISLLKNSTTTEWHRGMEIIGRNTNNLTVTVNALIQLAAGDYVYLGFRGNNKSGGTGQITTWFTGYLVSAT